MKNNTKKSSITLPPHELNLVKGLIKPLHAKSKVEVIRRGLYLLKESIDRDHLRKAYAQASRTTREQTISELKNLDHLSGEGLEEEKK
ncbi:MAG: hypothetical protein A3D19_01110 [Deltaproteobacteria bacterium RIFCSPHIGHO2_02_FULL_38_15]|nr:MAG: hypothetical protein A3D19_01110 [Deltaproteobacteria bacterium RIFCSPHIGHO2_02_FULL_38_15]OGQ33243.1 MAG: hypothetical protein A3A72_00390 [Deltaproteobacteria bacterium RIFCSPLOWO2_01_FULL_38_9]HBQ21901.1 hypothetical protein [Deltaproteobacteria bacterium]